eukprot:m51a1_g3959 hypothetical protein (944) ;mRNA; r:357056-360267
MRSAHMPPPRSAFGRPPRAPRADADGEQAARSLQRVRDVARCPSAAAVDALAALCPPPPPASVPARDADAALAALCALPCARAPAAAAAWVLGAAAGAVGPETSARAAQWLSGAAGESADAMRALEELLARAAALPEALAAPLARPVVAALASPSAPSKLVLNAARCASALTARRPGAQAVGEIEGAALALVVARARPARVVGAALGALDAAWQSRRDLCKSHAAAALPALRHLAFCGAPSAGGPRADPCSDSDSAASDAERSAPLDRDGAWRCRAAALACLQTAARCAPQQLQAHWQALLPGSAHAGAQSLLTLLAADPSERVRAEAADTVSAAVAGARAFMVAVAAPPPEGAAPRAFTPVSQALGASLAAAHRALLSSVAHEESAAVSARALRALAAMLGVAPYEKLGPALLLDAARLLSSMLVQPDTRPADVQQRAALMACTAALFNTPRTFAQLGEFLQKTTMCLAASGIAQNPREPSVVRIEALRFIGSAVKNYSSFIGEPTEGLLVGALTPMVDPDSGVRLAALKALEEATSVPGIIGETDDEADGPPEQGVTDSPVLRRVWARVLASREYSRVSASDQSAAVRACAASLLANLSGAILADLPSPAAEAVRRTILRQDESPQVRTAAHKALGALVSSTSSVGWIKDAVSQAVRSVEAETNPGAKAKAMWAIANACCFPALVQDMLQAVARSVTHCPREQFKVRANAVRAIGCLFQWLPRGLAPAECERAMVEYVLATIEEKEETSNSKAQWNACHSLGSLMKNAELIDLFAAYRSRTFPPLLGSLSCRNFKIRINALQALRVPDRLELYGDSFLLVWRGLVTSTSCVDEAEDAAAFRYRESLCQQTALSLSHVMLMATPPSVVDMLPTLQTHAEAMAKLLQDALRGSSAIRGQVEPALMRLVDALDSLPRNLVGDVLQQMQAVVQFSQEQGGPEARQ